MRTNSNWKDKQKLY